ncbi:MAG TPA: hypothetical protein VFW83_02375 [Bryobacteraceae bacterium]|nr:hypothetical protein [Bryobacteraceae bacterium]
MQTRNLPFSKLRSLIPLGIGLAASLIALGQQPPARGGRGRGRGRGGEAAAVKRPPLFFRADWKPAAAAGEAALTQANVANENLELKIYGDKNVQELGKPGDENNPAHVWTGLCATPCAVALRDKDNFVDLTGLGRIRWTTKTSGLHKVHPIVKLADGTWLVGEQADGSTSDWLANELSMKDIQWLRLDIAKVETKGNIVEHPDLSKVDEIGFTDLYPGSGHGPGGWVDVAAIEVYGKPVKR